MLYEIKGYYKWFRYWDSKPKAAWLTFRQLLAINICRLVGHAKVPLNDGTYIAECTRCGNAWWE